jgi:hypothetical protein
MKKKYTRQQQEKVLAHKQLQAFLVMQVPSRLMVLSHSFILNNNNNNNKNPNHMTIFLSKKAVSYLHKYGTYDLIESTVYSDSQGLHDIRN